MGPCRPWAAAGKPGRTAEITARPWASAASAKPKLPVMFAGSVRVDGFPGTHALAAAATCASLRQGLLWSAGVLGTAATATEPSTAGDA